MRKFYSLALLLVASVFSSMAYGYTGKEDITSSKLTNANFMADDPVAVGVITYAKDLADNGAGSDGIRLYGMQPVTGWTANYPSDNIKHTVDNDTRDAKVGGVFPIYDPDEFDEIDESLLVGAGGSYYAKGDKTKKALALVSVWSGNGVPTIYSQDVTLPAGYYMLVTTLYNGAGAGTITNHIGFTSASYSAYSGATTYPVGEWIEDTVVIKLDAETAGQISLGYQAGNYGSGSAPHLFISGVKLFTVDANEVEAEEIAAAKAELLSLINIGKVYNVDVTASQAVYDNPSATLAQVQAAIDNQKAINETGVIDLSSYFITNSHFDQDEPLEGGICTYDYDCASNGIPLTNYSMLPVSGWDRMKTDNGAASGVYAIGSGAFLGGKDYVVPTTMSDGSSEGKVLGFVTCWGMAVQYKQVVTLPAGEYTLTMSYYNTGGTTAITKNLIGFVADDGTEYLSTRTTFPVGTWTKDEIKFTLNEETTGYFSLGYQSAGVGSGSMPHFFTDGISLVYVGQGIDPSLFALKAAVSGANKILNGDSQYYTAIETELSAAVDEAQALVDAESTDQDANQAAYEKLTALTSAANASIAAYKNLAAFIDEGGAFYEAYAKYTDAVGEAKPGFAGLVASLDQIGDQAALALDNYDMNTEDINALIASLDGIIKNGVQEAWDAVIAAGEPLEEPMDISVLFEKIGKNGDFADWTTTKGSITTQFNVAEIYNNTPFVASQTLSGLPKGQYTVTTKGFYRIAANDVNYDEYSGSGTTGAYVFAGASKIDLTNVARATFETGDAFKGLVETTAGSGVYVINNREGAQEIFNSEEYGPLFEQSASTVLTEEGDLVFGITADQLQESNWVTWYEFSIAYNVASDDNLNTELIDQIAALEASIEALQAYQDENETDYLTSPVIDAIEEVKANAGDVVDAANEVVDSGDATAITAQIAKVKTAIADIDSITVQAKENVAVVTEALEAYNTLDATINDPEIQPSDEALEEAVLLIEEEATLDAIKALTTEEVKALIERINAANAALKIPADAKDASDGNPVDMTSLIANADIEEGATVGWKYTKNGGNGPALANGFEGTQSIEFWNSNVANLQFNIWQDLASLPAGKYELTAQASNSLNDQADPGNPGRAFLYAATFTAESDTTFFSSEPVAVQEAGCTAEYNTYSVIFTVEEGQTATIGFKSVGTMTARWFAADNFTLTYFGTESAKDDSGNPMSVEGIEAAEGVAIVAIYSATGAEQNALQKGLNIVKYADGSVKKILVK